MGCWSLDVQVRRRPSAAASIFQICLVLPILYEFPQNQFKLSPRHRDTRRASPRLKRLCRSLCAVAQAAHLMPMEDEVLTTTEAAKLIGISVRTAQLMIESGRLPSWKTPGGHRRVRLADVQALLGKPSSAEKSRSATVLVVTTEERQQLFAQVFEDAGHLHPRFQTNIWSAAIAAGARLPAVLIVDLDAWPEEGASLLGTLATDSRFRNVPCVAVLRAGVKRPSTLDSRVQAATLETLPGLLNRLTEEPAPAKGQLALGDFPVAPNERGRLEAVQRSGLVDTPAEPSFDRLTWLAANGLKSPVALMTLLTAERQWFKSRHGLAMQDTPRHWAFCNHTVLQRELFEVRDLTKHHGFAKNPSVADAPHFRFYAGAPVFDPDGFALGSICVLDYRPRQLDENQRRTLLDLAAIATDELMLRDTLARP
jgi:excisionase family DNA binding protein